MDWFRDNDYRVIRIETDEGLQMARKRPLFALAA